jgi:hypothetical protein
MQKGWKAKFLADFFALRGSEGAASALAAPLALSMFTQISLNTDAHPMHRKEFLKAHPINPVDEEENSRMPYFLQKQIKPLQ